ncbi:aldo/keto reductase [Chitinibacter sp. FCG-7]|uniref:Aldo/keto reductase n=1 Tax=Chitinibacter mangrovi TaxID=3153927 RepID=A0AAU7FBJ7_9NEIS
MKRIGFSVYTVEQTKQLLETYSPNLIQFPVSLFDQRFLTSGMIAEMSRENIALHARSIFLQGLLLALPNELPAFALALSEKLVTLDKYARQSNTTRLAFLMGFVQAISELEAIVIGITSAMQLNEIIQAWHQAHYLDDFASWSEQDADILDPSKWKQS